jgi:hypothetical protein
MSVKYEFLLTICSAASTLMVMAKSATLAFFSNVSLILPLTVIRTLAPIQTIQYHQNRYSGFYFLVLNSDKQFFAGCQLYCLPVTESGFGNDVAPFLFLLHDTSETPQIRSQYSIMKIFPFLSFAFAVTNFAAGNEQEQKKHGLKLISAMRKLKSSGLRGSNTNMQAREELERELVTFEHFLSLTTENNAETQADGELPNGTEETTYGNYGGQ